MTILSIEQFGFIKVVTGLNAAKISALTKGTPLYVSKATIERFEQGKTSPDLTTLQKLLTFLTPRLEEAGWYLTASGGIDRLPQKAEKA